MFNKEEILSRFTKVKGQNNQFTACCPAHKDSEPSLAIKFTDTKVLFHCFAGCSFEGILQSVGLSNADVMLPNGSPSRAKPQTKEITKEPLEYIREHIYTDFNGKPIAVKKIFKKNNGSKTAVWFLLDEQGNIAEYDHFGKPKAGLNGLKMPLYALPQLSVSNDIVFIVEGEKDADTLLQRGITATTSPNGAGAKWLKDYSKTLIGRCVVILTDNDTVINVTISRRADKWYAAFQVEVEDSIIKNSYKYSDNENQVIGVDLGVKVLATLSNGEKREGSKATRKYAKLLKRQQQKLSRKIGSKKGEKESKNYIKQQIKVARIYHRIANTRGDNLHKFTTELATHFSKIAIEDLNVSGMLKNHKLAKHIADGSFFEFRRQLEYKCLATGAEIIIAKRNFPSSQLCNNCGTINPEVKNLAVREWTCPKCGVRHDRDINAAINLKKLLA